ncbi:MAG: HI0074 family nucleotidyltransferase substrate-binding subunit [bacterium]|nr:HI0074 family nucleotidyltransferase substrate-binding subunit [bacterium]
MSKTQSLLIDFEKALSHFAEVLQKEKTDIVRDSAIKRFEFVFDLAWKALKAYLDEERGIICHSPKTCFKEAFQSGIIEHEEFWLKVTDDRNYTAHTYKEVFAEKIYSNLPNALLNFQELFKALKG